MASTTVTHVCLATIHVAPGSEAQAERRGRGKNTCRCVRPPVGRHCLTYAGHAAMHLGQAGVLAGSAEQPSRPCMCLQIQSALPTAGRKEARACPVCRVALAPPATPHFTSCPDDVCAAVQLLLSVTWRACRQASKTVACGACFAFPKNDPYLLFYSVLITN